jgi:RND family efflux transporter MFP subunit
MRVRFDPFPDHEIDAQIKEIGKEASKATRTYPVTLIMDQPEDVKILPGMAGKATRAVALPGMQDQAGIVIPDTAVFSPDDTGKTFVWVIDEQTKTVSKRDVKAGELLDSGISITAGLKPGEWIATAGVHYLQEGQQVRILSESSKGVSQ